MTTKTKLQRAIEYIWRHPGCYAEDIARYVGIAARNLKAGLNTAIDAGLVISCKSTRPGQKGQHETIQYRPSATAPDQCPENWIEWCNAKLAAPAKPLKFNAAGPREGLPPKNNSVSVTPGTGGDITVPAETTCSPSGSSDLPTSGSAVVETPAARSQVADAEGDAAPAAEPAVSDVLIGGGFEGQKYIQPGWLKADELADWQQLAKRSAEFNDRLDRLGALLQKPQEDSMKFSIRDDGRLFIDDAAGDIALLLTPDETRRLGQLMIGTKPAWA